MSWTGPPPSTRPHFSFPADSIDLCETYGPGIFGPGINLFVPGAARPAFDLSARSREMTEIVSYRIGAEAPRYGADVPRGLVAWADGPDVQFLTWDPIAAAESWPVVLLDMENLDTWTFSISATEVLVGLLDPTLDQPVIEIGASGFEPYR